MNNVLRYCVYCEKRTTTLMLDSNLKLCAICMTDKDDFQTGRKQDKLLKIKAAILFVLICACAFLLLWLLFSQIF